MKDSALFPGVEEQECTLLLSNDEEDDESYSGMEEEHASAIDRSNIPRLYNAEALLHMEKSMAEGFLILLTGSFPKQDSSLTRKQTSSLPRLSSWKDNVSDAHVPLGFAALCEGNVVDACFGVLHTSVYRKDKDKTVNNSKNNREEDPSDTVKETKAILDDAAWLNDDIKKVAVMSYVEALGIILQFQEKSLEQQHQLNWWQKFIRRRTHHLKKGHHHLGDRYNITTASSHIDDFTKSKLRATFGRLENMLVQSQIELEA